MKAMVLAAGVGERMRPLTNHLPKPLLPIANRPVMAYILAHLARHGFTEVLANLYHQAEAIADCFGDGSDYGVRLTYSYEEKLWGSAGSVKRNQEFFGDDPFLLIGADDLTDMDLWVVEPSEEVANYTHHLTTIGGHVSRDVTDGYGPEEYVLKKAMKGRYQVKTNYYASRSPSLTGGVTLQVEVFTNYGRANEKRRAITLRLQEAKDFFVVGEVDF